MEELPSIADLKILLDRMRCDDTPSIEEISIVIDNFEKELIEDSKNRNNKIRVIEDNQKLFVYDMKLQVDVLKNNQKVYKEEILVLRDTVLKLTVLLESISDLKNKKLTQK